MKKAVSILLCVLMLLFGTGLAEEASQAMLAQSFMNRLQAAIGQFDFNTYALRESVSMQGQEIASLRMQQDSGSADILITREDLQTPIEVQVTPDGFYAALNGTVYSLSNADLQDIISWLASYGSASQLDTQALSEMAQILLMYTLMPAVRQSQPDENTMLFTVSLTAKQVLSGLCLAGDMIVSNDRYLETLVPIVNVVSDTPLTAEDLKAQWPSIRARLEAVETDLALQGTVEVKKLSGTTLVNCDLTLTNQGVDVRLVASAEAASYSIKVNASLTQTFEENSVEFFNLDASLDLAAGTLSAVVDLPANGISYALNAKAAAAGSNFRLDAVLTATANEETNEIVTLDVDADTYAGNLRALLNLPISETSLLVTGSAQNGYDGRAVQASVVCSINNASVFTLNMNAVYTRSVFTLNASVSFGENFFAVNVYKDKTSLNASFRTPYAGIALQIFTNVRGSLSSFRFSVSDPHGDYFSVDWDGEALTVADRNYKYVFTGEFKSETLFVCDVETSFIGYSYYGGGYYETPEPTHAQVITELPDDGRLLEIRAIGVNGEETLKIVCSAEEKTEIVPLSEQTDIVVINREYIETLLQNLQNPQTMQSQYPSV